MIADLVTWRSERISISPQTVKGLRLDEVIQYVEDSGGWLGGISESLSELHQRARGEGAPDPVELARRLVQTRQSLVTSTPAGALVEIPAYEGDIDTAWASAMQHGCDDGMWLTLARARETTHPLYAIEV